MVGWEDIDVLTPDSKRTTGEVDVGSLVLHVNELPDDLLPINLVAFFQVEHQLEIIFWSSKSVNAAHTRNDHRITRLKQRLRRSVTHLVDLVVYCGVLLDVGIRGWYVGFRLIVIVVANEVSDLILREELYELCIELCGKCLVRGNDQRGAINLSDDIRHREGLSRTRDTEQCLVRHALLNVLCKLRNSLRLVSGWGEFSRELKRL